MVGREKEREEWCNILVASTNQVGCSFTCTTTIDTKCVYHRPCIVVIKF